MPITRTPARRVGITTIPGRVTVSFDAPLNSDGTRPITAEDQRVLVDEILNPLTQAKSFADFVEPIVSSCRRIIEQHGGRPGFAPPPELGPYYCKAGYVFPSRPVEASEAAFALEILFHLTFAQSDNIDMARSHAWHAGLLMAEVQMKFKWESLSLLGEKNRASTSAAGKASAQRARRKSRGLRWSAEVAERRTNLSKAAMHEVIERREMLRPGTVKKAIARNEKART